MNPSTSGKRPSPDPPPGLFGWCRRKLPKLLVLALGLYFSIVVLMMLLENYLIFPAPRYPRGNWEPPGLAYEDVYFQADDDTRLHGWYVDHPAPKAYVLFCHGNGENVGYLPALLHTYHERLQVAVFAFDYRGYGRSQGRSNEQGVLADGLAARRWLVRRVEQTPDQIVLIGRSLGGAVAVDLATHGGARALVLERTFTSVPDVAAAMYPWLPVRLLIRTRFDSLSKITAYDGPLLQSHGTADHIVPYRLGRQLFEACPSKHKQFFVESGRDHNDPYSPEYWEVLRRFLWNLP